MTKFSQKSIMFLLIFFSGNFVVFANGGTPPPPAPAGPPPVGLPIDVGLFGLIFTIIFAFILIKYNKKNLSQR